MKKLTVSIVLLCFVLTGCTGSFNLTKKVYNLHRSQPDKWQDEFVFLVVYIVPVYGISALADALIFNSIEFWTGENPVVLNNDGKMESVKESSPDATLSYNPQKEQMTISSVSKPSVTLQKTEDMVIAKNEAGDVLFSSLKNEKGEVQVYNKDLELVKTFSSSEVDSARAKYLR